MNARPLSDLRVLELGQVYNGPYCGLLLAAQGADVIKIEPPGGEILRRHTTEPTGGSYSFLMLNADKRGVTIDLKDERGRDLFLEMVEHADVVVENFREGVLQKLRLRWEDLSARNPRVILASGRGYRTGSAYAGLSAMDFTVQAISGHMEMTGFPEHPPVKAGATLADMLASVHLFGAILLALRDRDQTGRGRPVEVAMLDATFPSLMAYASPYLQTGVDPGRTGNRHAVPGSAPYGAFPTTDGWVAIMCATDGQWAKFCEICGDERLTGDASFRRAPRRGARRDWIEQCVGEWTRPQSRAEVLRLLEAGGIPCAPVRTLAEAVDDPYNVEQGLLRKVEVAERGPVQTLGSPIQLRDPETGAQFEEPPPRPAPKLGEHNHEVFTELLGVDETRLQALEKDGVI